MSDVPSRLQLTIEGMHCGACVRRVEAALVAAGAEEVSVTVGQATCTTDLPESVLREAVEALGFVVVAAAPDAALA